MGCDIHLFAEVKPKKNIVNRLLFCRKQRWISIDKWVPNDEPEYERKFVVSEKFYSGGRNYNLFCALCGVRANCFSNNPRSLSEPKGIPGDASIEVLAEFKAWGSDGHSHSWNTLKELKEFDWSDYGETVEQFLNEVLPKMEATGMKDTDVRIIYCFDN